MLWLRTFAALLLFTLTAQATPSPAWEIFSLHGGARAFIGGEWATLDVADTPAYGAEIRTGADGHLALGRAGDILTAAPLAKFDLEGDETRVLTRIFEGEIAITATERPGERFLIMTSAASLLVKGAQLGVVADASSVVVSVRQGLVLATDLATRRTVEVRAGETYRAQVGAAGTVEKTPTGDAALKVAEDAAAGHASDSAGSTDPLDRVPTGTLSGGAARGDAKLAEDAAAAVHEQRRKAKLGKADPRAVAAVRSIERDLLQGIDVEAEPWDDDFQWTEMEDGEVRLKPISRIVFGLHGAERFEFWVLFVLVCVILGGLTNAVLQETGFGSLSNALLVMTAFAAAILARDLFFRAGANLTLEPFLSMGMMMAAMPVLLLSGAFAKMRWRL